MATIAGSVGGVPVRATPSPKDELMSELSVGWDGRDGSVGEGSRPLVCRFGGIDTVLFNGCCPFIRKLLPLPFVALVLPPEPSRPWALGKADMETARGL